MEETTLTSPLKVLLVGQPTDRCPKLDQEQVAKIPSKLYNVLLSPESVREDFGDMGIVVRVRDKQHHGALERALKWITRGVNADFLTTPEFNVIRRQGDRKCNSISNVIFAIPCLLVLSS